MKANDLCFQVPFTRIRRGLKVAFIPESGEGGRRLVCIAAHEATPRVRWRVLESL